MLNMFRTILKPTPKDGDRCSACEEVTSEELAVDRKVEKALKSTKSGPRQPHGPPREFTPRNSESAVSANLEIRDWTFVWLLCCIHSL